MTHKSLGEGKRYLKAAGAGERQGESAVDLRRLEPPRFGEICPKFTVKLFRSHSKSLPLLIQDLISNL